MVSYKAEYNLESKLSLQEAMYIAEKELNIMQIVSSLSTKQNLVYDI